MVRTDLAVEAKEFHEQKTGTLEGVEIYHSQDGDIQVTRVEITSESGANALGKPCGTYITLDVPPMKDSSTEKYQNSCYALSEQLKKIINLREDDTILVVGLGNWNITPDAIGPKAVSQLLVTRHLFEYLPDTTDHGMRPVCAIAPGVLGTTGMETGEVVRGVCEKIKPSLVIAIDALASRRTERVASTIQITNTGINPGSGVGNKRKALNKETLKTDVIAVGVPMVVDAATIAGDTIDSSIEALINSSGGNQDFYHQLKQLQKEDKYKFITSSLPPCLGELMVTPKEVDNIVTKASKIIANGINLALHDGFDLEDIAAYVE